MKTDAILSWGMIERFSHQLESSLDFANIVKNTDKTMLPLGKARSYGDSCLNQDQILLSTKMADHFISFDRSIGLLRCEAGVTLRDILLVCSVANPDGSYWFPKVLPGTKFVTVGGAIANDVHGKNHHRHGSFGSSVTSFVLRRSDGTVIHCSPKENEPFFRATVGGLGLTGLIVEATLQLMRVPGLHLEVEEIAIENLDEFYSLNAESEASWDYTVAWVDCLAKDEKVGRGLYSRARHCSGETEKKKSLLPKLTIPITSPMSVINRFTLPLLNSCYRRKLLGQKVKQSKRHFDSFFFPLDGLGHWNRLYGRRGFFQYQCVIPKDVAAPTIRSQLAEIARSGQGSFLIVLKTFVKRPPEGMLSFPIEGTTLAIDFPNLGKQTLALLDRLDTITLSAMGKVYPAKDGRMARSSFQSYYTSATEFARYIDPRFSSSFWRRTGQKE